VFKKNIKLDDTIDKYKASFVASHGLLIHQMDVKTTFLNGELKEKIYMTQSNGYVIKGQEARCVSC
jgi:hypothetical protein